ncbi:hypothetical protein GCM10027359_05040 [Marilutibacter aestuarii]
MVRLARFAVACLLASLCACTTTPPASISPPPATAADPGLERALDLARAAARQPHSSRRADAWLGCTRDAEAAAGDQPPGTDAAPALRLLAHCSDGFLLDLFRQRADGWLPGVARVDGVPLRVQIVGASRMFRGALKVTPAADVRLPTGWTYRQPGFGLPVVLRTDRCEDDPRCEVYPAEGIHQWATAWVDFGGGQTPTLHIVDPVTSPPIVVAGHVVSPAFDALSFYAVGATRSRLPSQGVFGLFGGDAIEGRAGVYLLRDYDPRRTPVVMIHGLGSHPIIWAELSGAIWADPVLRDAYQVMHVVFQTNAPLLVSRRRVQQSLDRMWSLLDPEGDDPARAKMVLVGHSLGGVVARMLAVDSGDTLWNAAFTVPPERLPGSPEDVEGIASTFLLRPYPGVCTVVMLAAPHKGSPRARSFTGRIAEALVGRRAPEIQALRRLARANPESIQPELVDSYAASRLNSIITLDAGHPVRRAGESLLPAPGIRYHTIAGKRPNHDGDGVVPLDSATLSGADSTLVVDAGHDLYKSPEVIDEVLRILRGGLGQPCANGAAAPKEAP